MITKSDLETLSDTRLTDAQELFRIGRFSGAYYLAGYSVELGIKACIANQFRANAIPDKTFVNDVYSHRLDHLLAVAGLKEILISEMKRDQGLRTAWGIVAKWNEASRYKLWDRSAAERIIGAVGHEQNGIHQWLKKRW